MAPDVMDLNEQRQIELLEELGKLKPDDPKRKDIAENLKTLSEVYEAAANRELKRLDNNARIDIEETKLVIEQQKIENDRFRNRIELFGKICYIIGSGCMGFYAYNSDKVVIAAKPFVKVRDDFLRLIGK